MSLVSSCFACLAARAFWLPLAPPATGRASRRAQGLAQDLPCPALAGQILIQSAAPHLRSQARVSSRAPRAQAARLFPARAPRGENRNSETQGRGRGGRGGGAADAPRGEPGGCRAAACDGSLFCAARGLPRAPRVALHRQNLPAVHELEFARNFCPHSWHSSAVRGLAASTISTGTRSLAAADLALGLRPWRPHGCARTAKPGARQREAHLLKKRGARSVPVHPAPARPAPARPAPARPVPARALTRPVPVAARFHYALWLRPVAPSMAYKHEMDLMASVLPSYMSG